MMLDRKEPHRTSSYTRMRSSESGGVVQSISASQHWEGHTVKLTVHNKASEHVLQDERKLLVAAIGLEIDFPPERYAIHVHFDKPGIRLACH